MKRDLCTRGLPLFAAWFFLASPGCACDSTPAETDGGGGRCIRHEDCPAPKVCVSGSCAEHGGPCTTPFDCPAGLECSGGLCMRPAAPDGGTPDAGTDGGSDGGMAGEARIQIDPTLLDFGAVRAGSSVTLEFTVASVGTAPLTLLEVRRDTGTSPEFSATPVDAFGDPISLPVDIAPGDAVTVSVVYSPTDGVADSGQILVVSNAVGSPTTSVTVQSSYKGAFDIVVSPESLDFGYVAPGSSAQATLTVENQGANSSVLTLTEIRTEPVSSQVYGFTLPSPTPIYLFGGDRIEITVTYSPPASPLGVHDEALVIASTDPDEPTVQIPLHGFSEPPGEVMITPDRIDFGPVQVGFPEQRQITLENTGGQAVEIRDYGIAFDGNGQYAVSGPAVPFNLNSGGQVNLQVSFDPQFTGPQQSSGVDITHADPNDPSQDVVVNIPVTGEGISPLALVDPLTVDFGPVYVGQAAPARSIRIRNLGYGPLVVSSIALGTGTTAEFSVGMVMLPLTLNTGEETTFTVGYTPNAIGADTGVLEITTSDKNNPLISVTLQGEGTGCAAGTADVDGDPSNGCECVAHPSTGGTCIFPNAVTGCDANGYCILETCNPNFYDLDGDPSNGCEYACTFQSATDLPDDGFVDANCDGIDGDPNDAIFVSVAGSDTNPGTMSAPMATLAAAITAAASAGKDVYVSEGVYLVPSTITLSDGVSIYGGYNASTWARSDTAIPELRVASTRGMSASNITTPTVVDRIHVISADATSPGGSSYALFAVNASGLSLRHAIFEAGSGAAGADGSSPSGSAPAGEDGALGQPGCEDSNFVCTSCARPQGGAGGASPCGRTGGRGGNAGRGGSVGFAGSAGIGGGGGAPGTPPGQGNWNTPSQYWGRNGPNGAPGKDGRPGAPSF
ncbi:MAG: choice-of-anchor D domain-containing protein, partial [Deltaproteobacteria bacterium]